MIWPARFRRVVVARAHVGRARAAQAGGRPAWHAAGVRLERGGIGVCGWVEQPTARQLTAATARARIDLQLASPWWPVPRLGQGPGEDEMGKKVEHQSMREW